MAGHAFWSYSRRDDADDGGRIVNLARAVASEFEILSGEPLELFLDRDSLTWGDNWRDSIAGAVDAAVFFIPVYTPRYFNSEMCREEFRAFIAKANSLGVTERILGLSYIEVPDMTTTSDDQVKAWAAEYQYMQARDIRWQDPGSTAFRRTASTIAEQLVRLEGMLDASAGALREIIDPDGEFSRRARNWILPVAGPASDNGYAELISVARSALPEAGDALAKCIRAIGTLAQLTVDYDSSLTSAPTPNAKIALLGRYSGHIEQPAGKLIRHANSFTSIVENADTSVEAVFHWPPPELAEHEAEGRSDLAQHVGSLRDQSIDAEAHLLNLRKAMARMANRSRALNGPLSRINSALLTITDGKAILDHWILPEEDTK